MSKRCECDNSQQLDLQLKSVSSHAELMESMKRFGVSAQDLMNQAAKRQYELKDPAMRDDLAAARLAFIDFLLRKCDFNPCLMLKLQGRFEEALDDALDRQQGLRTPSGVVSRQSQQRLCPETSMLRNIVIFI